MANDYIRCIIFFKDASSILQTKVCQKGGNAPVLTLATPASRHILRVLFIKSSDFLNSINLLPSVRVTILFASLLLV